jgi:sulfite exporter TauE/SafE
LEPPVDNSCCAAIVDPSGTGGPVALGLLFTAGVTISLGHCVGMCGPIVAAIFGPNAGSPAQALPRMGLYHLGRITSYVLIGAAFGPIGSATHLAGSAPTVQAIVALAAGVLIVFMALGLAGIVPHVAALERTRFGMRVVRAIQHTIRTRSRRRHFGLGVANGFLPCGPVLAAAAVAAAAASPLDGMLAMGVYGIGTVPALVALGFVVGRMSAVMRRRLVHVGAGLVLLVGVQLALRGLGALGAVDHLALGPVMLW